MNPALTYGLSLLVLSCINFIPQMIGSEEGVALHGLVIIGTALMVAIWAAIPVFVVWIPLVLLLKAMGMPPRTRAVLAAGPAAGIGAIVSARTYGEVFNTVGGNGDVGTVETLVIVITGMTSAFLVWTMSPQEAQQA